MAQGKRHEPTSETRAQVEALAAFGLSQERIARFLGITDDTLRVHYATELEDGRDQADFRVYKTAARLAESGDCPAMTIFWLKTRRGWSEKMNLELSGEVGTKAIDLRNLNAEQLKALEGILEAGQSPKSS